MQTLTGSTPMRGRIWEVYTPSYSVQVEGITILLKLARFINFMSKKKFF